MKSLSIFRLDSNSSSTVSICSPYFSLKISYKNSQQRLLAEIVKNVIPQVYFNENLFMEPQSQSHSYFAKMITDLPLGQPLVIMVITIPHREWENNRATGNLSPDVLTSRCRATDPTQRAKGNSLKCAPAALPKKERETGSSLWIRFVGRGCVHFAGRPSCTAKCAHTDKRGEGNRMIFKISASTHLRRFLEQNS